MGQLIDDLLELSRLSRSELRREDVDLSAQAAEIMQTLRAAHPARAPVDFNDAAACCRTRRSRLLRCRSCWKISCRTPGSSPNGNRTPEIEFGIVEHAGKKAFFVRDNGAGFNMAHAEKLFKPFQRLRVAKEISGHRDRLSARPADRPAARRRHLGRGAGAARRGILFHPVLIFYDYSSTGVDLRSRGKNSD